MRQPSTVCSHTSARRAPLHHRHGSPPAGYTGVCMGPLFPATKQALADSADQGGADSLTHIAAGAFSSRGRVHARCVGGAQSVEKKERSDIRTCISGYTQALIDSHRRRHPPIHPTIRDYVSLVYLLLTFLICLAKLCWVGQAMSDSSAQSSTPSGNNVLH